jgi:hypothetical protein
MMKKSSPIGIKLMKECFTVAQSWISELNSAQTSKRATVQSTVQKGKKHFARHITLKLSVDACRSTWSPVASCIGILPARIGTKRMASARLAIHVCLHMVATRFLTILQSTKPKCAMVVIAVGQGFVALPMGRMIFGHRPCSGILTWHWSHQAKGQWEPLQQILGFVKSRQPRAKALTSRKYAFALLIQLFHSAAAVQHVDLRMLGMRYALLF